MNFVPMLRAHAEKDFFPIRPIAYVGLLASVFAFIFSDVWPGGFWIRALIGAVLGLLTVVLVNTANATTSAESCR